ncbi:hypothetical protein RI367_002219 [Sorochytrium milnesiophthora]
MSALFSSQIGYPSWETESLLFDERATSFSASEYGESRTTGSLSPRLAAQAVFTNATATTTTTTAAVATTPAVAEETFRKRRQHAFSFPSFHAGKSAHHCLQPLSDHPATYTLTEEDIELGLNYAPGTVKPFVCRGCSRRWKGRDGFLAHLRNGCPSPIAHVERVETREVRCACSRRDDTEPLVQCDCCGFYLHAACLADACALRIVYCHQCSAKVYEGVRDRERKRSSRQQQRDGRRLRAASGSPVWWAKRAPSAPPPCRQQTVIELPPLPKSVMPPSAMLSPPCGNISLQEAYRPYKPTILVRNWMGDLSLHSHFSKAATPNRKHMRDGEEAAANLTPQMGSKARIIARGDSGCSEPRRRTLSTQNMARSRRPSRRSFVEPMAVYKARQTKVQVSKTKSPDSDTSWLSFTSQGAGGSCSNAVAAGSGLSVAACSDAVMDNDPQRQILAPFYSLDEISHSHQPSQSEAESCSLFSSAFAPSLTPMPALPSFSVESRQPCDIMLPPLPAHYQQPLHATVPASAEVLMEDVLPSPLWTMDNNTAPVYETVDAAQVLPLQLKYSTPLHSPASTTTTTSSAQMPMQIPMQMPMQVQMPLAQVPLAARRHIELSPVYMAPPPAGPSGGDSSTAVADSLYATPLTTPKGPLFSALDAASTLKYLGSSSTGDAGSLLLPLLAQQQQHQQPVYVNATPGEFAHDAKGVYSAMSATASWDGSLDGLVTLE